jgi:ATP-independent RNA helicase DbpA
VSHTSFSSLPLSDALLGNLTALGYHDMTPIQAEALPAVLSGRDVIGQAKTGSGKTAVFSLGLLSAIDTRQRQVQALVICPTRELAEQVAEQIRKLARAIPNTKVLSLCGGSPLRTQANSLESGAHVVVGTPGRLEDHLGKQTLDLSHIKTLVLDEADRMLDMGFQPALEAITAEVPVQKQTLLFSATFPHQLESIAKRLMDKPKTIRVENSVTNSDIKQVFHKLTDKSENNRADAISLLLMAHNPESCVIFCNTKHDTKMLANRLKQTGFSALALHGDLEQYERDLVLIRFVNKSASILVATDVAARGLDIESVDLVINHQISSDLDVHVHRIGRTGRAGSQGKAITIFTEKESWKLEALGKQFDISVTDEPLPATNLINQPIPKPEMITVQINAGKKQKLRPGDILGALTNDDQQIGSKDIGKIHIAPFSAYVAINRQVIKVAVNKLNQGKIKGRKVKARSI